MINLKKSKPGRNPILPLVLAAAVAGGTLLPYNAPSVYAVTAVPILQVASASTDFAGGSGTVADPYLVATEAQLDKVRNYPDQHFKQTATIVLKVTTWDAGKGWTPIGVSGSEFKGSYDGNGFSISKLYINRPTEDNVGLFGILGDGAKLSNVALESASVIGKSLVGALVGSTIKGDEKTAPTKVEISNSRSSGTILGVEGVGGLIGVKFATTGEISNCSSNAIVAGSGKVVGGLVGSDFGPIKNSRASGAVKSEQWTVGGLVGHLVGGTASITNGSASGTVSGDALVGGLVGYSEGGIIESSYASGAVTASDQYQYDEYYYANPSSKSNSNRLSGGAGGLVGVANEGLITRTYATGAVTGNGYNIGGLIGVNASAQVTESYAGGNVALNPPGYYRNTFAGGLIGVNYGTALVSECFATGSVDLPLGTDSNYAYYTGGLIGWNYSNTGISVRDSYATGKITPGTGSSAKSGGLIGSRDNDTSIISGAYFDKTTTSQADKTKGGIPKATADMKKQSTYEGWDFVNTWTITEGSAYPELRWKAGNGAGATIGVTGVTLNKATLDLLVGGASATLTATVSPADAANKTVSWKSDSPTVATVDSTGQVTPVAAGTAKITVTTADGAKSAFCTVTVTAPVIIPSFVKGDANGDGKVTIMDAVKIARSLVGLETLAETEKQAADYNGDGKVSIMDAQAIAKSLVGGS